MNAGLFFVSGLVVLLLVLRGVAWRRRRLKRIQDNFTEFVSQVREGDFTKRMIPFMQGDFAPLAFEMNRMVESLNKTVMTLRSEKEFVANISHDLKTPLTVIRGYAETLRQGALDDHETALRFLEKIESNAGRLERLVADILQLAQLDSGEFPLRSESLNLPVLVEQLIEENRERAMAQRVTVFAHYSSPSLVVESDRAQLRQVIANLLNNAIQYTPCGGEVRIGVEKMQQGIQIQVEDSGMGISEQELPRIFERFYRVDKARSKHGDDLAGGGSGLGLAIVKQIVKTLGGTVSVTSVPNEGSCFTVFFPLRSFVYTTVT